MNRGVVSAAVPHAVAGRGEDAGRVFVGGVTRAIGETVAHKLVDSQLGLRLYRFRSGLADQTVDSLLRCLAIKQRGNQPADAPVTLNQSEEPVGGVPVVVVVSPGGGSDASVSGLTAIFRIFISGSFIHAGIVARNALKRLRIIRADIAADDSVTSTLPAAATSLAHLVDLSDTGFIILISERKLVSFFFIVFHFFDVIKK